MKMWKPQHRRTSHVAARIYLVFRPLSSRVSPRQPQCIWGPHGMSFCAFFRVLQPQAIGRFSRYSASKALCAVEGLERILSESHAHALYGQAGSGTSQACLTEKCCNAVTSRTDLIHRQQCYGSARETLAMYMELVERSMPWCGPWTRFTRHCIDNKSYRLPSSLTLLFQTRPLQYE